MAGFIVTGALAVLKIKDGKGDERYVYRGTPVDSGMYEQASIDHCVSVGLVSPVADPAPPEQATAKK